MKPTFESTVDILVKAYLNDTLVHGNCYACAVGNIVASSIGTRVVKRSTFIRDIIWENGFPYPGENGHNPGWGSAVSTSTDPFTFRKKQEINLHKLNYESVKYQIDSTGYTFDELARIEKAFEFVDKRRKDKTFNGLMAVVDVLADIHGIDLKSKEEAKLLFVKP